MSTLDLFTAPPVRRFPGPRPFQETTHRELRSGFIAGHRVQMVYAPTGAGKTYLSLRVCDEALLRGKRVMFICDRKTLIRQTSRAADNYGMPTHGIIQASNPRFAPWRPFQIASAQTLETRGITDDYDVVVVDEAHTLHDAVVEFVKQTKAAVIGLSASPFTKGLKEIYSRVINSATMDELVRMGVLTPLRVLSCKKPDMTGAKTNSKGEWTDKEAEQRGMGLIGDVLREWLEHAENRKTIIFGASIVHCEAIVAQFKAAGVEAACFTSHTKDDERADLLAEYEKADSKLRVLVSVEALAKGFDVTDVSCVCDLRPLRKSLSTFVQMIGRGVRQHGLPWMDPAATKKDCLLLDFSGNIIRFASDFSDLYYNGVADLVTGEKKDQTVRKDEDNPVKRCPACGFEPCGKRCIRCGFEKKNVALEVAEDGRAQEVDVLGFQQKKYAANADELYAAIATYERSKGGAKARTIAAIRFKELTGQWPGKAREATFDTVEGKVNAALKGKLRSLQIAFARRPR